jgi:hypothetical protein
MCRHLLVHLGNTPVVALGNPAIGEIQQEAAAMTNKATFPTLVEAYFTDRLTRQRQASSNTIASHRDTFRLLLGFAQRTLKKGPFQLTIEDLTPSFIGRFLDHLRERTRKYRPHP